MDDRLKQFRAWDVLDGRREIFCPEESVPQDDFPFSFWSRPNFRS